MSFLDKLKNFCEANFGDIFSNNKITLFSIATNQTKPLEVKDGNRLIIDLKKFNEEDRIKIKELIDSSIQEEDSPFLTEKSAEKVKQIKKNLPKLNDKELLFFYKDKINSEMYGAFEMSLIVRNSFRNGEDIIELKRDIALKFPAFGNNICNLTTSDYFDKYFRDLYNEFVKELDFKISKYQAEVERIVFELPYMVFINRYKSFEEFLGEVRYKLSRLKKYGTDKLKLHSIGKENVDKSLSIAEEFASEEGIIIEKDVNKGETIATITFRF